MRKTRVLGVLCAVLVPAGAVGALELPHVFEDGEIVSASEMNENFSVLQNRVDLRTLAFSADRDEEVAMPSNGVSYLSLTIQKPVGIAGTIIAQSTFTVGATPSTTVRSTARVTITEGPGESGASELSRVAATFPPSTDSAQWSQSGTVLRVFEMGSEVPEKTIYLNGVEAGPSSNNVLFTRATLVATFIPAPN